MQHCFFAREGVNEAHRLANLLEHDRVNKQLQELGNIATTVEVKDKSVSAMRCRSHLNVAASCDWNVERLDGLCSSKVGLVAGPRWRTEELRIASQHHSGGQAAHIQNELGVLIAAGYHEQEAKGKLDVPASFRKSRMSSKTMQHIL